MIMRSHSLCTDSRNLWMEVARKKDYLSNIVLTTFGSWNLQLWIKAKVLRYSAISRTFNSSSFHGQILTLFGLFKSILKSQCFTRAGSLIWEYGLSTLAKMTSTCIKRAMWEHQVMTIHFQTKTTMFIWPTTVSKSMVITMVNMKTETL